MSGVSFIVTVFDKRDYLPRVVDALARQVGPFEREFIFVDDGSSDGSAALIAALTRGLARAGPSSCARRIAAPRPPPTRARGARPCPG